MRARWGSKAIYDEGVKQCPVGTAGHSSILLGSMTSRPGLWPHTLPCGQVASERQQGHWQVTRSLWERRA